MALAEAEKDPKKALKLCKSELNHVPYKGIERSRIFSPQELHNLFQQSGIEVIQIYGNRIVMRSLPENTQTMTNYGDQFFSGIADMELRLSKESSLLGMGEYLQIVGKKMV